MTRSKIAIGVIIILLLSGFMVMRSRSIQPTTNTSTMHTVTRQQPSVLTEKLEMGVVELHVKDMASMRRFYEELVGLTVLSETKDEVTLGANPNLIIRLVSSPTLSAPPTGSAGLYHTATVFESRSTLAETLERILRAEPGLYQGSADHLVSEAFYFADPEGNGVELYFDKDPSTWQWKDGKIEMGSLYIDVNVYIKQYGATSAAPNKKMGHVHLKVGSIAEAKKFYVDVLGLRVTSEMPTALFVSDGQYHHHLGMNTWESNSAGKREESLGLKSVEFFLAAADDITRLKQRLDAAQVKYQQEDLLVTVLDPWNNELHFRVK